MKIRTQILTVMVATALLGAVVVQYQAYNKQMHREDVNGCTAFKKLDT